MIRIHRPAKAPSILVNQGADRANVDELAFHANRRAYRSGKLKFVPDRRIFGARPVVSALLKMSYGKCCYCEVKVLVAGYAVVEHYRPKGAVRQDDQSPLELPGYFWLAYEWRNLLLSCPRCNTSQKRTLFPLANPKNRARTPRSRLQRERPLLIDPAAEDPRLHIEFRKDAPLGLTVRGRRTIEVLGLRSRPDLVEERLKHYRILKSFVDAVACLANSPDPIAQRKAQELRDHLEASKRPDAEFSAVALGLIGP